MSKEKVEIKLFVIYKNIMKIMNNFTTKDNSKEENSNFYMLILIKWKK